MNMCAGVTSVTSRSNLVAIMMRNDQQKPIQMLIATAELYAVQVMNHASYEHLPHAAVLTC